MINLYLHSTMYLFQLSYLFIDEAGSEIYIPLCIYFNHQPYNQHTSEDNLHSTMYLFQRDCIICNFVSFSLFTFHYVSISTQIFRSLISIRIIVALLSTKQTSIIFILTCSGNIWIITDKIRIVDLPVILQYYVPTVKA